MFENSEWSTLILRLIDLTKSEKLKWHIEERDIVVTPVGDIEYVLGSVDSDGRAPFFFSIWDPDEKVSIARLESQPVPEPDEHGNLSEDRLAGQSIPALLAMATRSATGAPKKLNQLMSDLDQLDLPF